MKTIFDKTTRDEVINRINTLHENSRAQWGKMNVYQMLSHCTRWEEMVLGKRMYKRILLGFLFGKMSLKSMIRDENPLKRNIPTLTELKVKEIQGDVAFEKKKWISLLEEYEHFSNTGFIHPFCGSMTKEQIEHLAYKHADHHLRQFNA